MVLRRGALLSGLAAAVLALGACGDDEADTTTSGGDATGDALRFVAIVDAAGAGDFTGSVRLGLDAALKEINDAGGVDGRPLAVEICKAASTPDSAAKCAREAVRDEDVLGIVGNFMQGPDGALPVLEKAKMASIGDYGLKANSLESPVSFPIASITSGFVNAALLPPAALKAKRVALAAADVPVSRAAAQQLRGVVGQAGAELVKSVFIPVTATDLSAPVQTLRGAKADAIIVILPDQGTKQFLQAYRQVDPRTPLVVTGTTVSSRSLKELGPAADNLYVGVQFDLDSDGQRKLAGLVSNVDGLDDIARNSYVAVRLAARGLQGLDDPTRDGLLQALGQVEDFDVDGLTPPLDYTAKRDAFPRAALRSGYFARAQDGGLTLLASEPVPTLPGGESPDR
ncbi:MAG: ABC transporter substrate-binding protein [Solirubrobacteraceae bacterium]